MNLYIVKSKYMPEHVLVRGNYILEITREADELDSFFRYFLYSPEKNLVKEIAPEIKKVPYISVDNCMWNSDAIYFVQTNPAENKEDIVSVNVYKYNPETDASEIIHSFEENISVLKEGKRIKVFVLSENNILLQTELEKKEATDKLMGNIEFHLTLCDINAQTETEVTDINLINNGIDKISPVSATHIMIKTGYSYLLDERISEASENDALIESVMYGSMSFFINNLTFQSASQNFELLDASYKDKSIVHPRISGDYIVYSMVDRKDPMVETTFYNFTTGKKTLCKVLSRERDDYFSAYVIGNKPYMSREAEDRTEFINLLTQEIDCVFYGEEFVSVIGDFFVFKNTDKKKERISIYRYPKLKPIEQAYGRFLSGCVKDDNCYIYLSRV